VKYRPAILAGAIGIIAAGIVLYMRTADDLTACASTLGGFVRALDPASARACASVNAEHDASIAIAVFGSIVMLAALVRGKRPA
jgi:hypothetical protein